MLIIIRLLNDRNYGQFFRSLLSRESFRAILCRKQDYPNVLFTIFQHYYDKLAKGEKGNDPENTRSNLLMPHN